VAPPAQRPPQVLLPPEDVYKNALSDYTKGNYDLAIAGFRTYIQNYPRTSLVPNAQYWLGESYYGQKHFAQAIEEFDVVVRDFPDSPKVPSALFKQGDAYLQMGETKRASTVLCELMTKHPKTREARLARERNIRCR
jgi:tol-pal system protein YbgF